MKKIITISLLCIIGFSQGGYFIFSAVHQLMLKSEMKEKIARYSDETDLVCISYTDHADEIVWEEEGKEFFYNKKMYDVIRTDTTDGKVFLYCINDEKEKNLISQNIETAATNNTPGKKSGISKIVLPLLFFEEQHCISSDLSLIEQKCVEYKSTLHTGKEENESPPPRTNPV